MNILTGSPSNSVQRYGLKYVYIKMKKKKKRALIDDFTQWLPKLFLKMPEREGFSLCGPYCVC